MFAPSILLRSVRQFPAALAVMSLFNARRPASDRFPVAEQLLTATSHFRRADILLRLPDAIVLGQSVELVRACREACFPLGILFLEQRITALHSNRDAKGDLTPAHRATLATWQQGFAELAGRGK